MSANHTECLICGSTKLSKKGDFLEGRMVQCGDCKFVFAKPIPTEEELIKHYEGYGRNDYLSPITVKRYHEILDMLEPYKKTNNLIDVGCGIGLFAEVAVSRGWNVYGTEYTDQAMEICVSKGIKMNQGKLNPDNYEPEFFDVITSFEVIEHINNPIEEIAHFNKILRKGGALYITTPNFNSISRYTNGAKWTVVSYPEHLSYYTQRTLTSLLKKENFKKRKIWTTGFSITRHKIANQNLESKYIDSDTDDEKMRGKMETIWYWKLAKKMINGTLNLFKIGDAMKALFIKG